MLIFNKDYIVKKTIFGKRYLSNSITGDVIDINEITEDIVNKISTNNITFNELIKLLSEEYSADVSEIQEDTKVIVDLLKDYNVIL